MSWWFDGKPTVYYCLGTDDTKRRQLESFTVSLIPRWEALLNESSTSLAGKYLQWFPSRSGSLGSTFAAQVSWSRFVWQWSLAVLSFPQDWKAMLNTQVMTRDAFVPSTLWWNDTALVPAANVIQVSTTVPRGCKARSDPVQYRHKKSKDASRERAMVSASHDGWKQSLLERVCFGFWGCNHRWLPEGHDSSRRASYCHTVRNYIDLLLSTTVQSHEGRHEQWKLGRCVWSILTCHFASFQFLLLVLVLNLRCKQLSFNLNSNIKFY